MGNVPQAEPGILEVVARNLHHHRTVRNMTLSELARRTGCSAAHLSRLERGEGGVGLSTLRNLAGALEVQVADLLEPLDAEWRVREWRVRGWPPGVKALWDDEHLRAMLNLQPDECEALARLEYRGRRLVSRDDAAHILLVLRRLVNFKR